MKEGEGESEMEGTLSRGGNGVREGEGGGRIKITGRAGSEGMERKKNQGEGGRGGTRVTGGVLLTKANIH